MVSIMKKQELPSGARVKNPLVNAGDVRDTGLIPELGRSLGGGHGNPLQYSCLENPMDRRDWKAMIHRVSQRVRHNLSDLACTYNKMVMLKKGTVSKSIYNCKVIFIPSIICPITSFHCWLNRIDL